MAHSDARTQGELTFKSAKECAEATDRRATRESPWAWELKCRRERRLGHRQVRCELCRRWRWPDDRCNLFTTARPVQERV